MTLLVGLLFALNVNAGFGAAPIRDVTYEASLRREISTFDKGYLIEYAADATILVYGPDGQFRYEADITSADGASVTVVNVAVDSDGVAAVGYVRLEGGGIAIFDASGKLLRRIETGPFKPLNLCFSPGHSIWALGWQADPDNGWREARDYQVLRRYSRDGQETGRFLPRDMFSGPHPVGVLVGLWNLRAAKDRLGALLYRNRSAYEPEWIEVDFDGRLIGRWRLGAGFRSSIAFTFSGQLYTIRRTHGTRLLSRFDRQASSWVDLPDVLPLPELYGLQATTLGADGDAVVIPAAPPNRLLWFKVE